jgi:hypothetical protein
MKFKLTPEFVAGYNTFYSTVNKVVAAYSAFVSTHAGEKAVNTTGKFTKKFNDARLADETLQRSSTTMQVYLSSDLTSLSLSIREFGGIREFYVHLADLDVSSGKIVHVYGDINPVKCDYDYEEIRANVCEVENLSKQLDAARRKLGIFVDTYIS